MINIQELRIGSIIVNNTDTTVTNLIIMKVVCVSDEGYVIAKNSKHSETKLLLKDIEPLFISDELLKELVRMSVLNTKPRKKIYFYFPNQTPTYFLVHDQNKNNYFLGMIDLDLPEKYRRITKPFNEYHKLQNAYKTVYDQELIKFDV